MRHTDKGPETKRNMDEFQTGEETGFVVDEVSSIIKESVEGAIGGNAYQHSRVNQWTTSVVEQCLSQLTKLGKPFKYIVEGAEAEQWSSVCKSGQRDTRRAAEF
ncbi:dynein light chain Tctex-type 1 isoform X2 [Amia ocellicauda]|uniref:dynein light chain Tctex-type 1 isoform X2 n=1 Tax=Amia ocellicauda TaxID=2972642 RepID=UPI003464362A